MQANFFEDIDNQIKDLDVSVLVNNVGLGTYSPFDIILKQELYDFISMNCMPIVFLTRNIIPKMLKRYNISLKIEITDQRLSTCQVY